MLKEQTVINECYILQTRIGEDTFTENWSATAIFSAKKFLLRFLKESVDGTLIEKLRSQAMLTYRVQGSSIADIIEFESYQGRVFISSEFHGDTNLAAYERSGKGMKIDDVCSVLLALARGLSVFHAQGIMYGNLNPENVLIGPTGSFMSSIRIQKPCMLSLVPSIPPGASCVAENFAYISGDYKSGKALTETSDVYTLGVHLVRMLTGKIPFPEDEKILRESGASLTFTANALLRRGIWTDLVRIALRALIEDSPSRYRSCAEFIADLRLFVDTQQISSGASEDYFRAVTPAGGKETTTVYPSVPVADRATVERIESRELTADVHEKSLTVDEYIRNGIKTITTDRSSELFGVPVLPTLIAPAIAPMPTDVKPDVKPTVMLVSSAPATTPETTSATHALEMKTATAKPPVVKQIADKPRAAKTAAAKTVTAKTTTVKPRVVKPRAAKPPVARSSTTTRHPAIRDQIMVNSQNSSDRVTWDYHRIHYDDVIKIIGITVKRARKGSGCFRFIQEPTINTLTSRLFHALEGFKHETLYINLGSLEQNGKSDIKDFLLLLRFALTRVLSAESEASRRYLARKVKVLDSYGSFASAPIGKLLYGKDEKEIDESVLDTVDCQISVLRSLYAFGRKDKPLVIVVRHGECITRELDGFLNRMTHGISSVPVCVLVFFSEGDIESWHSLSSIERMKFETGVKTNDS